ncbi:ribosome biogenesis GTPase Der [Gallaecimonas pentaromativorans]|uniref:ribosome biogenesis GTPase Der n=1 Tax=Gallaecimonas pentaromativorans TaxID=584787 RepID=UPI00067F0D36|nr:ribosome biogenesis GTPase Der [Gallaecimonas pentaromativorans]MED5524648.1 ribosome biogenesis GTPase Der [Pseudomonadota bacterium]
MLPVVALVGRPNVGKSTLFNRLTNSRDALVADYPGLTRDRKYGQARYGEHDFILVDTGGIEGDEKGIDAAMARQSLLAMEEADVVMLLVDARDGLTAADQAIARHIRQLGKPVFLVANKVDGIDGDSACAEFWGLSLGEVWQIAAAHGRGVTQLLDNALIPVVAELAQVEDEASEALSDVLGQELIDVDAIEDEEEAEAIPYADLPVKIAIVGRPNVGKSTLTNRILGEERVVVFDMPGTTRDSVYIPMERDGKNYIIIDTAGVRRRGRIDDTVEKFSVVKTLQAIEDANVVLLTMDAREGLSDQDLNLLGHVLNAGRALVLVVNKWDGLSVEDREEIKRELDRRLGFIDFARLHFISALHGSGVGNLFESISEAFASATQRVSTSKLTRILQMAQDDHQPPLVSGRRVKLKYAHAGGYNPPRIIIHGNQVEKLPQSYKRYLMNYYRKSLQVIGTPIHVEFQEGDNPYAGKRNSLTLTQQRKRKRLMKFIKSRKK